MVCVSLCVCVSFGVPSNLDSGLHCGTWVGASAGVTQAVHTFFCSTVLLQCLQLFLSRERVQLSPSLVDFRDKFLFSRETTDFHSWVLLYCLRVLFRAILFTVNRSHGLGVRK